MNAVLEWTKRNVLIVIFAAVMLAAIITLPLMASGMNANIRKELDSRARKSNDLKQLERTQYAPPGSAETEARLITDPLLEQYRRSVKTSSEDSARVVDAAIRHNRKGRTVLHPQLFPQPPRHERQVMPRHFHERLVRAYEELMDEVSIGSPPELETLREEIERQDAQFRQANFAKSPTDPLTEEEEKVLRKHLTELRLQKYRDAAAAVSTYLDRSIVEIPAWNPAATLAELYEWQWRYWIHEDVLKALADANRDASSVLEAPVKHVTFLRIFDHQTQSPREESGGSPFGGGPMSPGQGGAGGPGQPDDTDTGPPQLPDPNMEIPLNYTAGFTGRTTCALYDVRYVDLELIVDTAALPQVFDALARWNFMTVTRLRVVPADPYEAAQSGFVYGSKPVSRVVIQLETIWLRAWTAPFMPASVRRALGIPSQTPGEEMG